MNTADKEAVNFTAESTEFHEQFGYIHKLMSEVLFGRSVVIHAAKMATYRHIRIPTNI